MPRPPLLRSAARGLSARPALSGSFAAALIALLATYYPIFDGPTQRLYSDNPDAVEIVAGAQGVSAREIGRWWTGQWLQASSAFYRPLSSTVMWAQYQLWGTDFQKYCLLSWLVHAASSVLVFLLTFRLFSHRGTRAALVIGLLAVVLWNLRRGIVGPGWPPAYVLADGTRIAFRIVYGEMPYWPAQTDLFSLLFSLGSLLAADEYALSRRRRHLGLAVLLFVVALLFKEMALTIVFLVPLLLWYRRGSLPWREGLLFAALGAVFLAVRAWAVPDAANPQLPSVDWLGTYLHWRLYLVITAGLWWHLPAAAGILTLLYAWRRFRFSAVWFLLGAFLWALLAAQLADGNFAYVFLAPQLAWLLLAIFFLGGIVVLLRSREPLLWLLLGMLIVAHLPVLHLKGPHYLYWPAAFWGMLGAGLWLAAVDWWRQLPADRRAAPGEPAA